jgi:type II secretory pathway component PulJ
MSAGYLRKAGRHRGVMMIEMLMLIIILGVFAVVATRMFVTLMKLNQQTAQVHTDTVRFDAAMRALRADVWSATQMSGSGSEMSLNGGKVQWKVQKDGTLVRVEQREGKRDEKRWEAGLPQLSFMVKGSSVVVTVTQTKTTRGGELQLISATSLAERLAS